MYLKPELTISFFKFNPAAVIPAYQTAGASGFDLHSTEDAQITAGQIVLVPTGLGIEIPEGYELQIRARSGLAAKKGIFLVNGIGTIDSDYRGEIKVILSTCLNQTVVLNKGERIAQGVVVPVVRAAITETAALTATVRGAGGFGSTGIAAHLDQRPEPTAAL